MYSGSVSRTSIIGRLLVVETAARTNNSLDNRRCNDARYIPGGSGNNAGGGAGAVPNTVSTVSTTDVPIDLLGFFSFSFFLSGYPNT